MGRKRKKKSERNCPPNEIGIMEKKKGGNSPHHSQPKITYAPNSLQFHVLVRNRRERILEPVP